MFLIVAKWKDNSDSIFLVGKDPTNSKMPDWRELFRKLDTIADPADASIRFARVSREFMLLRDEETLDFSLDDPIACNRLRSLQLAKNLHLQWYEFLSQNSQSGEDNPFDTLEDDDVEPK